MSFSSVIGKLSEWTLKPILFVAGVYCGWRAAVGYLNLSAEDSIIGPSLYGTTMHALLGTFLVRAAFFEGPPWKNESLRSVIMMVLTLALSLLWWIGSCLGAAFLVGFICGKDPDYGRLLLFVAFAAVMAVQYVVYVGCKKLWHLLKSRNRPSKIAS